MKKIKSALISVYYKDGLERIVRKLAEDGVAIYSTGGTLSFIESLGLKGHLGRKPDGLSVDPRRTRQDAPPESFRRHPRPPRQPERLRTGGAVRNTRDRRGDRRPLSVRADRRFGRARAGRHREDRHRRHLADPRRSEKFQGRRDRTFGRPVRRILRNHRRAA